MKLETTHTKSATKTFTLAGTALRVTDPCYSIDTWCAETLYGVMSGTWHAHVGYDDPTPGIERALKHWDDMEADAVRDVDAIYDVQTSHLDKEVLDKMKERRLESIRSRYEELRKDSRSMQGRVIYLQIIHESALSSITGPDMHTHVKTEGHIGVDSGQAGFFDHDLYQAAVFDKDEEVYDEEAHKYVGADNFNAFYQDICDQTGQPDQLAVCGFGVASCTGYGDGGYDCFIHRNEDGLVDSAFIAYLMECEEGEGDYGDEGYEG